eukprot:TRINITY_DN8780_c0_g1_i1.p1 TRINITY_DN8780_c0_g1~~TRINITY_DN8780_c0_g1_i1.p1  ORF type:complete len:645 (+),score=135.82 TRINITY_DN8780_c0_g1_i1:123-2057(+)
MNGYLIQTDPYDSHGNSWWINQDNFYRQVRNFKIDLTRCPPHVNCVGIHWQIAQATSITNVVFEMSRQSGNQHQGIWMENGSGGFFSDLIFYGGKNALWVGNQQFTSRNLTIHSAATAIYMNWNWGWTFKTLTISNCQVGLDMTAGKPSAQDVGSVVLLDINISNTPVGVLTSTSTNTQPKASGTLLIDNAKLTNVQTAVRSSTGATILNGPGTGTTTIHSWGQGQFYDNTSGKGKFIQNNLSPTPKKSSNLLNGQTGYFFERPRPQYGEISVNNVVNVKLEGAAGDGKTDDTAAISKVLTKYQNQNKVLFFPAGTYLISDTVTIPPGTKIVGEVWSVIMATNGFTDIHNPKPVWKIGNKGDKGSIELSDLIFSTKGPQPGAIMVEWNIHDPDGQQGVSGMWDCHFRIGGAEGTEQSYSNCPSSKGPSAQCMGPFLLLHLTSSSSAYLENVWAWTADHALDAPGGQTSIFTGRGILIESTGPVWLYGTAAEHNTLYQFSLANAQNIYLGMIQTETPYYQPTPKAPAPRNYRSDYFDPDFSKCTGSDTCAMAWGMHMYNSKNIFLYGAGHYSFFDDYSQTCIKNGNCQQNMVQVLTNSQSSNIYIYNLNTEATTNMVVGNNGPYVEESDNKSTFCSTILADLSHA